MPNNRRFRVTLTVDVSIPAPFVKNGVPDQLLLAKIATFKVGRSGQELRGITIGWAPIEEDRDA